MVVGLRNGSDFNAVRQPFAVMLCYLFPLALAVVLGTKDGQDRLERWLLRLTTAASIYVIAATFTGLPLPHGDTAGRVITLTETVDVDRIRLDILAPLFICTLLVIAKLTIEGSTLRRWSQLALFAIVFLLSFNRSTWTPLLVSCLLFVLFRPGAREPLRLLRTIVPTALVAGAVFVLASTGAMGSRPQAIAARIGSIGNPQVLTEKSYKERQEENRAARATLHRDPVFGVGFGRPYGLRRPVVVQNPPRIEFRDWLYIHNSFLRAWLNLGILGIVAFVFLGWRVIKEGFRARRELPPAEATRHVAAACAYIGFALQSIFTGSVFVRPTILAIGCTLALVALPQRAPQPA
jgi:O-antigen ligase